jgi:hypothetical protein
LLAIYFLLIVCEFPFTVTVIVIGDVVVVGDMSFDRLASE